MLRILNVFTVILLVFSAVGCGGADSFKKKQFVENMLANRPELKNVLEYDELLEAMMSSKTIKTGADTEIPEIIILLKKMSSGSKDNQKKSQYKVAVSELKVTQTKLKKGKKNSSEEKGFDDEEDENYGLDNSEDDINEGPFENNWKEKKSDKNFFKNDNDDDDN